MLCLTTFPDTSYNLIVVLRNYSVLSNGSIITILFFFLTILDFAPRIIVRERQEADKRKNIFLLTLGFVSPRIEYHIREASVQRRIRQAGNMDIRLKRRSDYGAVLWSERYGSIIGVSYEYHNRFRTEVGCCRE